MTSFSASRNSLSSSPRSDMTSLPYGRQTVDDDDIAAVVTVLKSDYLTTGPAVAEFEAAISRVAGGAPAVAVSSGTAALHAAYAAGGIGPGTEIITSPLTFMATASAAIQLGAAVKFVDIDDRTLCIDPSLVEAAITDRTRAIVAVDFAGQPADLTALRSIADRHSVLLIEDAAHSIGASWDGLPVGSVADATCFSFHPVKTITTGEGGAVTCRSEELADRVRSFRNHGLVRDADALVEPDVGPWHQEVQSFGLNYRMPDINAALGTSQLKKLRAFVDRRAEIVEEYRSALADLDGISFSHVDDRAGPAWHLFAVRVAAGVRRHWFEHLRRSGIGVQVHYLPAHLHPVFRQLGWKRGDLKVAEGAYGQLISLPLYPSMDTSDVMKVVGLLQDLSHEVQR